MDTNNKYYNLIEKLVRNHRKFQGYEAILDEIVSDVYVHSEDIIKTIDNEAVIQAYLQKVVSTSIITVPKRLNFHCELNHRVISPNNDINVINNKNEEIVVSTPVTNESISQAESDNQLVEDVLDNSNIIETPLLEETVSEELFEDSLKTGEDYEKSNPELVNKMINSIAPDMVMTTVQEDLSNDSEEILESLDDIENVSLEEEISLESLDDSHDIENIEQNSDEQIEVIAAEPDNTIENNEIVQDNNIELLELDTSNEESDSSLNTENYEESLYSGDEITFAEDASMQEDNDILQENELENNLDENIPELELVEQELSDDVSEEVITEELSDNNDNFSEQSDLIGIEDEPLVENEENLELNLVPNNDEGIEDNILNMESSALELEPESSSADLSLSDDISLEISEEQELDELHEESDGILQDDNMLMLDNSELNEDLVNSNDDIEPMLSADDSADIDLSMEQDDLMPNQPEEDFSIALENEKLPEPSDIAVSEDASVFKLMDYSAFSYTPEPSDSKVDDEYIGEQLLKLQNSKPDLSILKIFELKYKQNMTISDIAEELHVDKQDVVTALDEMIKLV